jgi:signal transduction histidine kinase
VRRAAAVAALAIAGAAVGLVAEREAYAWDDLRGWIPDLLAGWTLIGLGLALLALRRPRGAAALLLVAGFTWFAFNFASAGPAAVQAVAARAAFLHRGPLLQLGLALPAGRPRTRVAERGIALAWVAAFAWPLWAWDGTAVVLAAAFVVLAGAGRARARGRRGRWLASRGLAAVAVLGAAIVADALASAAGGSVAPSDATVLAYDAAVAVTGIVLFSAALGDAPAALAEQAVALERGGARLRDALRDLLGDPALELGFRTDGGALADDLGRPLAAPARLASTTVTVDGEEAAVVFHDDATLEDPVTRAAVLATAALAAERARLRVEVGRQATAVEESRRRLLLAEEDERRRLAERLDRGAGAVFADVERLVAEARVKVRHGSVDAALDRASDQLARVRPELDVLVQGLGGVDAAGLVPALRALAAGLPVEVDLDLTEVAAGSETASAVWFVCSECLANTVKHAGARRARVSLTGAGGRVFVTVEDDGRGGADAGGSGLVGLADRVNALGGQFSVSSVPGQGTRVTADLPSGNSRRG